MNKKINKIVWLGTILTTSMHLLNKISSFVGTNQNILKTDHDKYYDWRFGKIRYTKQGKGNPILLIHNETPGSSIYEFHKLIDLLSNEHEVYAIDLLGYGLSEKPQITYTNYLYVELINDFIKNIIQKRTDIITSGYSATIALKIAKQNKENVRKIMMIMPPDLYQLNEIPSKQMNILKAILQIPIIGTFIYHNMINQNQIKKLFETQYFYDLNKIQEKNIQAYIEGCNQNDIGSKFTFSSFYCKYMNSNILNELKTIDHSLMIVSSKEFEKHKTLQENYQYYNAAIETVNIEKVKYLPHLEKPHTIYHLAKIFLA